MSHRPLKPARAPQLRIAAAQPNLMCLEPGAGSERAAAVIAANAAAHAETVLQAAADVIVFPELSLTGYVMDAPTLDPHDSVLDNLIVACAQTSTVALAGAPVLVDGERRIGVLAVTGSGAVVAYTKMSIGGPEVGPFVAGPNPAMVEALGWRIGLGVCKDTRIDVHLEKTAALGVDVYAAGMVHTPDEFDELAVRAQRIARKYSVPVVFSAHAGPSGSGYDQTSGGSGVWDASGALITQVDEQPGSIAKTTLRTS